MNIKEKYLEIQYELEIQIQNLPKEFREQYDSLYKEYCDIYEQRPHWSMRYGSNLHIAAMESSLADINSKLRFAYTKPLKDLTLAEYIEKTNEIKNYKLKDLTLETIKTNPKKKFKQIKQLFNMPNIHLNPDELMPAYVILFKLPFGIYFLFLKEEYQGPSKLNYCLGKSYRWKDNTTPSKYYHQVKIVELF